MTLGDPWWGDIWGYRTAIAEWVSLLSLIVSGYAAWAITRVKSQILGRVRLPTLVSDIEKNAKNLAALMREYEANVEPVGLEIAKCGAHVKVLALSIKGPARASIRDLNRKIKFYQGKKGWLYVASPRNTRQDAWHIYEAMNALIEELHHTLDDMKRGG